MNKILNISIDVDNIHHYLKARRLTLDKTVNYDSIYQFAIPRMLDIFEEYNIRATFFIIGEDAKKYPEIIKKIHAQKHEIANHTNNHFQHFLRLSKEEKRKEIKDCNKILEDIIGEKIIGFRAPGWNIDSTLIEILNDEKFIYDSSVFPSKITPLINIYNVITNRGKMPLTLGENYKIGFASKKPYKPNKEKFWKNDDYQKLIEFPITVVPFFNLPFLGSSLFKFGKPLYNFSKKFIDNFYDIVLFELHAIEMVDYKEVNDNRLSVKPGFNLPIEKKIDLYHHFIKSFKDYNFKTLKEIAFTIQ